jgi:hypothetical protein
MPLVAQTTRNKGIHCVISFRIQQRSRYLIETKSMAVAEADTDVRVGSVSHYTDC